MVPDLTSTSAWLALLDHSRIAGAWQMRDLFSKDPQRFERLSLACCDLLLDYSKNRLDGDTLELLLALARERGIEQQRAAMFSGSKINTTEQRAVLHTALRAPREAATAIDGRPVAPQIHEVLDRMGDFTARVRDARWLGYSGRPITDIVNIGIGGSDLGPKMACQALRAFHHPRLRAHFVSNVDAHDLDAVLHQVEPETTLFIIASKTFTTMETMMNAHTARAWFLQRGSEAALASHFVAVSTNTDAVQAFGIDIANMFPFWDWVGGRYSVWSAIGLSLALMIGAERFREFLDGGFAMDRHFCSAPLAANMPVLLALVGIWNRNFLHTASQSIAPYHQDLRHFPAFLQQLEMESNGKRVTLDGRALEAASCPVVWGDTGTNGQHAYFQLLHQGCDTIPVDFIAALRPAHALQAHHSALLANCFAQSEALMLGKSAAQVHAELQRQGVPETAIPELVAHKTFPGNRPSNTILLEALTPATLGALVALYEHKTFVQGVIWGVNSFDQWGVELGKVLATRIQSELAGQDNPDPLAHDSSTANLIARARKAAGKTG
ncbi:glucose-6-phosphate isomerase [Lacisediminimonas sp.]|uniref:glucose-6-phosphate isomerase n=1 Tax=Lacisediminimonas sp. TaxID=3060582 RepID=UPI00271982DA|nr:glucose-6-phosphate isomerase [Lacisediminimonas sp.]MDO8299197.1 glucose-6-phosphate isomerase [Lacisediminimonas sp.]